MPMARGSWSWYMRLVVSMSYTKLFQPTSQCSCSIVYLFQFQWSQDKTRLDCFFMTPELRPWSRTRSSVTVTVPRPHENPEVKKLFNHQREIIILSPERRVSAGREIKSISIRSDRGFDGAEPSTATTEYSGGSHPHKHTHVKRNRAVRKKLKEKEKHQPGRRRSRRINRF